MEQIVKLLAEQEEARVQREEAARQQQVLQQQAAEEARIQREREAEEARTQREEATERIRSEREALLFGTLIEQIKNAFHPVTPPPLPPGTSPTSAAPATTAAAVSAATTTAAVSAATTPVAATVTAATATAAATAVTSTLDTSQQVEGASNGVVGHSDAPPGGRLTSGPPAPLVAGATGAPAVPAPPGSPTRDAVRPRLNKSIALPPPPALNPDATLRQYESWRSKWHDYAISIELFEQIQPIQTAHLRRCLDDEMNSILIHTLNIPQTSDQPLTTIISAIDAYMRRQRNMTLRRLAYNQCQQAPGQTFDAFYVTLKQLATDAELCMSCRDVRLTDSIIAGIQDRELAKRIMSTLPPPSLEEIRKMCQSHETASRTDAELSTPATASLNKLSAYKKNKRQPSITPSSPRSRSSSRESAPPELHKRFSCFRCGDITKHKDKKCPAKDATCKYCKIKGHFDVVCFKAVRDKNKPSDSRDTRSIVINNVSTSHFKCPTIDLHLACVDRYHKRPRSGNIITTPDSGSEITAIGVGHFCDMGMDARHLKPSEIGSLRAANGTCIDKLGTLTTTLTYGGRSIKADVEVLLDFPAPVLSWFHAKQLGILPPHYPKPHTDDMSCCKELAQPVRPKGIMKVASAAASAPTAPITAPPAPATPSARKPPQDMTPEQAKEFFCKEFADVLLSPADLEHGKPLKPMKGEPMQIHLKEDAVPFARHTPNAIPFALRDACKNELERLVSQHIIAPVPDTEATEWSHVLVCVMKANGKPRITIDLTHLNKQVIRTTHPSPSPHDVIRSIPPGARFFTKCDAMMGYFQIPLAEASQHLTTFVTPWGRYKFLRSPMGFVSSGDVFCRRGDMAFAGIGNHGKVVDDSLMWDFTYAEHLERVYNFLCRCRDNNITINLDKFIFAEPSTDFCGYQISSEGIEADPKKIKAIAEFPTPSNITDLRSFFGLVNQLADFTPDIASCADALRPLLSPKNEFIWNANHEEAFNKVKQALVSTPTLAHFDPAKPTALQADASRLHGIGYALLQKHDRWRLIQCGSRFLSETEKRYSTGEIEMLGAVWATHKCKLYLLGMPAYDLVLDHKPLIPMFNEYTLDQVPTPRLQRLREKLAPYTFRARWQKGKDHAIPDALSRAPVDQPDEDDKMLEEESCQYVRSVTASAANSMDESNDQLIDELRSTAALDPVYKQLIERVCDGFPSNKSNLPAELLPFWRYREELTYEDGLILYRNRIFVPTGLRKQMLERLHSSHRGVEATRRRASQTVWWPAIGNDIATTVEACTACQSTLPSQQKEPLHRDDTPTRPFESVSVDLFSYGGHTYLIYADRFSGWAEVHAYQGDATSRTTVRALRKLFAQLGVPNRLRSDGGPQFTSAAFRQFMGRWHITHDLCTPYYPQANGHAEAHVKNIKHLLMKTTPSGDLYADDQFTQGLIETRNTPGVDGASPAMLLLGRPLRSLVPAHRSAFDPKWVTLARQIDARNHTQQKADRRYDAHAKDLPNISLGTHVRVQNHSSRRWDTTGTVVGVGVRRDYLVRTLSGNTMWRNRRYLRPVPPPTPPRPAHGGPTDPRPEPAERGLLDPTPTSPGGPATRARGGKATFSAPDSPRRSPRLNKRDKNA